MLCALLKITSRKPPIEQQVTAAKPTSSAQIQPRNRATCYHTTHTNSQERTEPARIISRFIHNKISSQWHITRQGINAPASKSIRFSTHHTRCKALYAIALALIASISGPSFPDESQFANVQFDIIVHNGTPIKIKAKRGTNIGGVYHLVGNWIILPYKEGQITLLADTASIDSNTSLGSLSGDVRLIMDKQKIVIFMGSLNFNASKRIFDSEEVVRAENTGLKILSHGLSYSNRVICFLSDVNCTIKETPRKSLETKKRDGKAGCR